jgi:hypothetical protein
LGDYLNCDSERIPHSQFVGTKWTCAPQVEIPLPGSERSVGYKISMLNHITVCWFLYAHYYFLENRHLA